MKRSGLRFAKLATRRFPPDKAQEIFDLLESDETGKVMFVMGDTVLARDITTKG